MQKLIVILFSLTIYSGVGILAFRRRHLFNLHRWPPSQALRRIWIIWLGFLSLLAPLSYYEGDMRVWLDATRSLLEGRHLPPQYVYLPVYAQALAALSWPLYALGGRSDLLLAYVIQLPVILCYAYCAKLMAEILPGQELLAPLGTALAPATVFYLFHGTNHIVMWLCLLAALALWRSKRLFWAGFFASLGCYKFLLIPTVLVLFAIIIKTGNRRQAVLFLLGGIACLVPSLLYYIQDPQTLLRVLSSRAAIGAHSSHVEPFHFLYFVSQLATGFEGWYIGQQVWFYISVVGAGLSLLLFLCRRLNTLQSLALSYGFVALFAPEPFRIEPMVGALWLDAVYRDDLRSQTAIFIVLFTHAAILYDVANSRLLTFAPDTPLFLWEIRGFYLGMAIIVVFVLNVCKRNRRGLMM